MSKANKLETIIAYTMCVTCVRIDGGGFNRLLVVSTIGTYILNYGLKDNTIEFRKVDLSKNKLFPVKTVTVDSEFLCELRNNLTQLENNYSSDMLISAIGERLDCHRPEQLYFS